MTALGNNNKDLTEMNRSLIVSILQRRGICSRAEIAKTTGLTQAAITKIISALIELGVVVETGMISGAGNRRSIGIKLVSDHYKVLGVKFSRQMFSVGLFDISGRCYTQKDTPYALEENPHVVIDQIKAQLHAHLAQESDIVAIGLALPGPYLRQEGRISVVTRMPAWENINFIKEFENEFEQPVFIEHDANAGALAEWWFGGHEGSLHSLCYFLIGEGVGAGVIENGELLLGCQGAAGEIGHISLDVNGPLCQCGNHGCLELYCCVPAVLQQMRQAAASSGACCAPRFDTLEDVFQAARERQPAAVGVVKALARTIGYGCVTLINAYNPQVIFIGDAVAAGADLLLKEIQNTVRERVNYAFSERVSIRFTDLSVDPILYGAAALATGQVLKNPSAFIQKSLPKTNGGIL